MIFSTFITAFLWLAVYSSQKQFGGYSKSEIMSYILFLGAIMALSASTRTTQLAGDINDGSIMNTLLKPISIFGVYATNDAVDKLLNTIFSVLEIMLVARLLHITLVIPIINIFFVYFLVCGILMLFFVNLLLSFVAFWTTEIWAPRFIFFMIIFFVSGTYFPLDLLPTAVYRALLYTPIPYFFFLPAHILVKGVQTDLLSTQLVVATAWTVALYWIAKHVWRRGIAEFSFWGK